MADVLATIIAAQVRIVRQGRFKKERGIHSAKTFSSLEQRNKFRLPVRQTGAPDAAILAFLNRPCAVRARIRLGLAFDPDKRVKELSTGRCFDGTGCRREPMGAWRGS